MANQNKQPQPVKAPDYVSPDYSFTDGCKCPVCGGEMDTAVYYVAELAGQFSNTQWQGGTKKTITTTHYTNIRDRVGGICVSCYKKDRKFDIIIEAVLASGLLALAILVAVRISKVGAPALIGAVIAGYFGLKLAIALLADLMRLRDLNGHTDNSKRGDTLSILYVNAYKNCKERPCKPNEVMMDSMTYRGLQKQNR